MKRRNFLKLGTTGALAASNISVSIISCESKLEYDHQYDILKEFINQFKSETKIIDFSKKTDIEEYLLHGWSSQPKSKKWGNYIYSFIIFYSHDVNNDKIIEIFCQRIKSLVASKPQIVWLILNDKNIGSFIAGDDIEKKITFTLPTYALKSGINILKFKYNYLEMPKNIFPGNPYETKMAVAFSKIHFKNNLNVEKNTNNQLLQKSNSLFYFPVKLPDNFEIELDYQNLNNSTSRIVLIDENEKKININLPPNKTNFKKNINFKNKGIYYITFSVEGAKNSYTIWKKVSIKLQKSNTSKDSHKKVFTKLTKPDILLYVIDTLRPDHLGCYGYHRNTSPNIDKFAHDSTLYFNSYATSGWTKASGASIVTGLLAKNNKTMDINDILPSDLITLAEVLKENGYYTIAYITNFNVGAEFGFDKGFIEFHQKLNTADNITDNVLKFIDIYNKKTPRKPLFLMTWTQEPHNPYKPLAYAQNLFNINKYTPINVSDVLYLADIGDGKHPINLSQLKYMVTRYDQEIFVNDHAFGNLIEGLKYRNMYDNSIIILTADHGEEFLEHDNVTHGKSLYNEVIRIPLIIKANFLKKGRNEELFQLIDIYPTIIDYLGISAPYKLDGISLLQYIPKNRTLYFEQRLTSYDLYGILENNHTLIFNRRYKRPRALRPLPVFELYKYDDINQHFVIEINSFEDYLILFHLFSYINEINNLGVKKVETKITPELDQKLRDLGYIK